MRVGVDTGGTFTDVVARDELGRTFVLKLPSTPGDPSIAIADGVAELCSDVSRANVVHGTTVATNALLERKGCHVVFVTTAGFEDLLELRRQDRANLYALRPTKDPPLTADTLGVAERVGPDGAVEVALEDAEIARVVDEVRRRGADAVAICLLHAYANGEHERRLGAAVRGALPNVHVTLSSRLVPEFREYERASTAVVNAYVGRIMAHYIGALRERLADADVEILQSSGGRMALDDAREAPVHTVLSGPAGGVVGAFSAARRLGFERVITFDMGGTSTDVSLCEGEPRVVHDSSIGGLPLRIPTLDIETVGAGGGSLAWIDPGGALRVGPRSAGADPGPAAYGRNGEGATVTDAHVVMGSLRPDAFLGGELTLDAAAASAAVGRIAAELGVDIPTAARGILDVADATMVRAIKVICARHGRDPRDFALVAFGGAGGLHACRLADLLGIGTVIVPANPGLLSAQGMLEAPRTRIAAETIVARLTDDALERAREALAARLGEDGSRHFWAALRYRRQSFEIDVPADGRDARALREAFDAEHAARFGYADHGADVELVTLRLVVRESDAAPRPSALHLLPSRTRGRTHDIDLGSGPAPTRVVDRLTDLRRGEGPMVLTEYSATTVVPPQWSVENRLALILRRAR